MSLFKRTAAALLSLSIIALWGYLTVKEEVKDEKASFKVSSYEPS